MDVDDIISYIIIVVAALFVYAMTRIGKNECGKDGDLDDEDVEVIEEENGDITIHIRNPKR